MAKEKNSFIVYYDFEEQTATLSDQQVGRLIRVMLDYEKRGVLPDGEDTLCLLYTSPGGRLRRS